MESGCQCFAQMALCFLPNDMAQCFAYQHGMTEPDADSQQEQDLTGSIHLEKSEGIKFEKKCPRGT